MNLRITIDVKPKGKGRPRFDPRSGRAYTPAPTREYEKLLRDEIALQWGARGVLSGPIAIALSAEFQPPKSARKPRLYHTQKPDADNVVKAALDAMKGVVFEDDAQIVELRARKAWAERDALSIDVWGIA